MASQGKSLSGVLHTLSSIVHSNTIVATVQGLAQRYVGYGVHLKHYSLFGTILLATLEDVSGDTWSMQLKHAYLSAYSLVLYIMLPILLTADIADVPEGIPATITHIVSISAWATRRTLAFDYGMRFHPGDAVWFGLPIACDDNDDDNVVHRHFCILSICNVGGAHTIDLCVVDVGTASDWLLHPRRSR
ncbi:Aste57867_23399 [Aphanomyces stellatus]|uniref:Aste57867_23399 protein n=1 Tax=Aphanomyces stellatus TaxID=120398 RepID=A0A485LMZ7_9STRA|nr:hypothetical protein As57867_023328 [Aphanomyces stellatus]VFU00045.1 Aste57867_23399 [Aphanomyces stellatus]